MYNLDDIKKILIDFELEGNPTPFDNFLSIVDANETSLVWVSPQRKDKYDLIKNTKAKNIICGLEIETSELKNLDKCYIKVCDPKLQYIRVVSKILSIGFKYEIHPSAVIHPEAVIEEKVYIGPNTYVGKCNIKTGCIIYGNSFLYDNTKIGKNVIVHAGTVIGADGYGYAKNEKGEMEKFPHIGGVEIQEGVEIGANTCIDRGSLGNTIIKKNAKIDNLVHIAHNVVVGENAMVIAHAIVGGSTVIEDSAWIAPNASIREGITIGKNSMVGLGAVITKSIPNDEVWIGNPGKKLR